MCYCADWLILFSRGNIIKRQQRVHCTQAHRFIYTNIVCITIAYQQFVVFFYLYGKYRTISFKNANNLRKSTCDLKIQKGIWIRHTEMFCLDNERETEALEHPTEPDAWGHLTQKFSYQVTSGLSGCWGNAKIWQRSTCSHVEKLS